tara:strand:- start:12 stop:317 length:306 start_codon:yes stop_codon:yes gene_type:complete
MSIHNKLYRLTLYQVEPIARQYNLEANVGLLEELNRSFPNVENTGVANREVHQWMKNKVAKHKVVNKVTAPSPPPQKTQAKTIKKKSQKEYSRESHVKRNK